MVERKNGEGRKRLRFVERGRTDLSLAGPGFPSRAAAGRARKPRRRLQGSDAAACIAAAALLMLSGTAAGADCDAAAEPDKEAADALDEVLEAGLAALCESLGTAFTHWDAEAKRCIALDFSSDQIYEPN